MRLNPFMLAVMNNMPVTEVITRLFPKRRSKHAAAPGTGKVRINRDSSLKKLMRAARRDMLPDDMMGLIVFAQKRSALA